MDDKKYTRKVIKMGKYSLSVVIPGEIADELNIKEKQKLILYRQGNKIIIEDWKK